MSFEKLNALDLRVRNLVQEVIELRRANAALQEELRHAYELKNREEERSMTWEKERTQIRDRIEKVLDELDVAAGPNGDLQETLTGDEDHGS